MSSADLKKKLELAAEVAGAEKAKLTKEDGSRIYSDVVCGLFGGFVNLVPTL